VANLPTSKTAAAIFSQTPVLIHNLLNEMGVKKKTSEYDGYSACPIFVGDQKLMLAEFVYGGNPSESLNNNQQNPGRLPFYLKKHLFPLVYWELMTKGIWQGKNGMYYPS